MFIKRYILKGVLATNKIMNTSAYEDIRDLQLKSIIGFDGKQIIYVNKFVCSL